MSWVLATILGVAAALLLYFMADWRAVQAIAIGVVTILLIGIFLTQAMCGDNAWGGVPASAEDQSAAAERMAAPAVSAPTKKPAAKKPAAKKPAAKKAAAAKPPVLFESRPDQVDDLKLISGVGPKLEGTLHKVGVYQFAQIANWKKADIATVDDKLSFKGRIERDEWVKQAKILAKGGDTEFSAKKRK